MCKEQSRNSSPLDGKASSTDHLLGSVSYDSNTLLFHWQDFAGCSATQRIVNGSPSDTVMSLVRVETLASKTLTLVKYQ